MALPKQVEEAANLAEELYGKMNPDTTSEEEETEAGAADTEEIASEDQQDETLEITEEDVEEEQPSYEELYRKAEQARKTLQGKYDAEVPRLHAELKELKERVFERIGEIAAQKKEEQQEPIEESEEVDEVIERYREEYGDELIDLAKHIARKELDSRIPNVIKPIEEKVSSFEEMKIEEQRAAFESSLSEAVAGDWKAALEDEGFKNFLEQPEPNGLYTYGEVFAAANNNWDAQRMAKIFNAYLETQKPKPKADPRREALIAPAKKSGHEQPAATEKRIWTEADIEQFKRDDRMGKYSQEESAAIWEDLLSAVSEGRIR